MTPPPPKLVGLPQKWAKTGLVRRMSSSLFRTPHLLRAYLPLSIGALRLSLGSSLASMVPVEATETDGEAEDGQTGEAVSEGVDGALPTLALHAVGDATVPVQLPPMESAAEMNPARDGNRGDLDSGPFAFRRPTVSPDPQMWAWRLYSLKGRPGASSNSLAFRPRQSRWPSPQLVAQYRQRR